MNLSLPNALLNIVLTGVIAWMAVTNHRLALAACSDPGSPLSDMTRALPPAISSAPGSLEMTTKEVMPTDAGSQDIQSVRPATHNSDTARPVASGRALDPPPLATWACMHNGTIRRCNPDGTLTGEQDAKAYDRNAPSEADMKDDPTLVIRYWKVRMLTQHQKTPDGRREMTAVEVNAMASATHQQRAQWAAKAALADAAAAQKAKEGQ